MTWIRTLIDMDDAETTTTRARHNDTGEQTTANGLTADAALAWLRCLAHGLTLDTTDARVLRPPADNAMIALPTAGLVARICVNLAYVPRLRDELLIGAHLARAAIPATRPANNPPTAQAEVFEGRAVTWWEFIPSRQHPTLGELAAALRRLHEARITVPGVSDLNAFARLDLQVRAAAEGGLPDGDVDALERHWRSLERRWAGSRWPREPRFLVHGDPHEHNALRHAGATVLLDFEDAGHAPPAWDSALPVIYRQLGWIGAADYAAFTRAYGADPADEPEIDVIVAIRMLRMTGWYVSRVGREPHLADQARHRITTLLDPSAPKHWIPG